MAGGVVVAAHARAHAQGPSQVAPVVVATPVAMIVAAPWLSFWGQILLLDVALLVAFCALCQWRGLQRQQLA